MRTRYEILVSGVSGESDIDAQIVADGILENLEVSGDTELKIKVVSEEEVPDEEEEKE